MIATFFLFVSTLVVPQVFVETKAAKESFHLQEPVRLRIRFGLESAFLENAAIQPFAQTLDIPVKLQAAWIANLPGSVALENEKAEGASLRFVLNDDLAFASRAEEVSIEGRRFVVYEVERTYLPVEEGAWTIPAASLHYAYATQFEEDFVRGKVPVDRHDVRMQSAPLSLRILPWPEQGRPPEFTGAVGRFSMRSQASPLELEAGQSLRFTLWIEGEGNLEFFQAPDLSSLRDFHFYGKIEEKSRTRRRIVYDLSPRSERVTLFPSVIFAFLDPEPLPQYRTLKTDPISLRVWPGAASETSPPPSFSSWVWPVGGMLGAIAVALLLRRMMRKKARTDRSDSQGISGVESFRRSVLQPGADVGNALASYLAGRLHCSVSEVIAPDLSEKLLDAGVSEELARQTVETLRRWVASRYGGQVPPEGVESSIHLVQDLETSFQEGKES